MSTYNDLKQAKFKWDAVHWISKGGRSQFRPRLQQVCDPVKFIMSLSFNVSLPKWEQNTSLWSNWALPGFCLPDTTADNNYSVVRCLSSNKPAEMSHSWATEAIWAISTVSQAVHPYSIQMSADTLKTSHLIWMENYIICFPVCCCPLKHGLLVQQPACYTFYQQMATSRGMGDVTAPPGGQTENSCWIPL